MKRITAAVCVLTIALAFMAAGCGGSSEQPSSSTNKPAATKGDTTPPQLKITSPADNTTTDQPQITVTGATEPTATVMMNNQSVPVNQDGTFSLPVTLAAGDNDLRFTVTDTARNTATVSLSVFYNSPDLPPAMRQTPSQ